MNRPRIFHYFSGVSIYFLTVIVFLSFFVSAPSANAERVLKTVYCDIAYPDDQVLSDFFWRISGKRMDFEDELGLARSRVDRLVDRVQRILDMYPDRFRVKITLVPVYKEGHIASYTIGNNTIRVHTDKITDGVLAHEMAHAVICNYFEVPPPAKMQEILSMYVDRHLWEEF